MCGITLQDESVATGSRCIIFSNFDENPELVDCPDISVTY